MAAAVAVSPETGAGVLGVGGMEGDGGDGMDADEPDAAAMVVVAPGPDAAVVPPAVPVLPLDVEDAVPNVAEEDKEAPEAADDAPEVLDDAPPVDAPDVPVEVTCAISASRTKNCCP